MWGKFLRVDHALAKVFGNTNADARSVAVANLLLFFTNVIKPHLILRIQIESKWSRIATA